MGREQFLREDKPKHYPRAHTPEQELEPGLVRRVPARPGRFPVGLGADKSLYPPREKVNGIPLSVAAYVGRVDEVTDDGEVTVRVWERPSAWEGLTTLDAREPYFSGEPAVGDLLWIWTWTEVSRERGSEERVHVEVERRELDDEDRARLHALLETLREEDR